MPTGTLMRKIQRQCEGSVPVRMRPPCRRAQCGREKERERRGDWNLALSDAVLAEQDAESERDERRADESLQCTEGDEPVDVARTCAGGRCQDEGHHADHVERQHSESLCEVGRRRKRDA